MIDKNDIHAKELQAIYDRTIKNGGCTFNVYKGRFVSKPDLYMVSIEGQGETIPLRRFNLHTIKRYIVEHIDMMGEAYLGTWIDGDMLHFDLNRGLWPLWVAIDEGIKNHQKAIYHCKTGKTIYL